MTRHDDAGLVEADSKGLKEVEEEVIDGSWTERVHGA